MQPPRTSYFIPLHIITLFIAPYPEPKTIYLKIRFTGVGTGPYRSTFVVYVQLSAFCRSRFKFGFQEDRDVFSRSLEACV